MSRRKRTPEISTITRPRPVAYARKHKSGSGDGDDDKDADKPEAKAEAKPESKPEAKPEVKPEAKPETKAETKAEPKAEPKPEPKPDVKADAPQMADETPTQPARSRVETIGMPAELAVGPPPDMPAVGVLGGPPPMPAPTVAPPPPTLAAASSVEDPTNMPGPREVPGGGPDDPAAPPGFVPPGDSRSLRREREFALIYRLTNAVITRWGTVGTRGQWRVVEYPTTASASHAYAKECSRFVSEGFSDYRE